MSHETNPFRLSMLRHSQSPLEDPFEPLVTTLQPPMLRIPSVSSSHSPASSGGAVSVSHMPPPSVPSISTCNISAASTSEAYAGPSIHSQPPQSNPFGVDLSEVSASPAAEDAGLLEPPSYFDSEGRRHSDPTIMPRNEKSTDERYRKGLEEGIRIAQEQEKRRRREMRERRSRKGVSREATGREPANHDQGSCEHRSRRIRSKSESAGHQGRRDKPKQGSSLDVIDKMDVTGVYGGSGFHHDGPFDACAPHRNKTSKRIVATPISAFPADGPNNSLAVEDPRLLAYRKEETVYGRGGNADLPPEISQASFDPTDRGVKVHGQQTMGLGSTTFIDGTPASRDAIEAGSSRTQSLSRSKSVRDDVPKSLLSRVRSLRVSRH